MQYWKNRVSYYFLAVALGSALIVFLLQEVVNRNMDRHSFNCFNNSLRLQELNGLIRFYDEVLSMSSKLAVTTGDPRWEQRYYRLEPRLDLAIDEAIEHTGGTPVHSNIIEIAEANEKLVKMEHSALSRANRGDQQGARAILFSDEYQQHKQSYQANLETFSSDFPERATEENSFKRIGYYAAAFFLVLLLGYLVTGLFCSSGITGDIGMSRGADLAYYKVLMEDLPVMAVFYDERGVVNSVNKEFSRCLGYRIEEVLQPGFRRVACPRQEDFERLSGFISTNEAGWFDISIKTKPGKMVRTVWIKVPLSDGTKLGLGLKNELLYSQSQQLKRLSVAVEQSPTSIVITDDKGNIEYVNQKFTDLTGYSLHEAVGNNPRILKSGKVDQGVYNELWSTISSGLSWRGEFLNKKKDGSDFWEMASISPLHDEQGQITHYVGIKEDITELKRIEDALKNARNDLEIRVKQRTGELAGANLSLREEIRERELAEEQLERERTRLEIMLDQKTLLADVAARFNSTARFSENLEAVLKETGKRMDLDHVCMRSLENEESQQFARLSSWNSSGDPCPEFCDCSNSSGLDNMLMDALNQDTPLAISDMAGKNQKTGFCSGQEIGAVVSCPLIVGGKRKGLITFTQIEPREWEEQDISLFKAIADMVVNAWEREQQILARLDAEQKHLDAVQLMERSSRLASIGVMAAGITHEINQPLNTIKLTADGTAMWMERHSASVPDKIVGRINRINSQVDRINEIIKHMKEFWISPSNRPNDHFELNEALERALALVAHQAESHGIRLEKRLNSFPLTVEGNTIHLEQIIVNLVVNAVHALNDVSRSDKQINIDCHSHKNHVVIEVSDNANGLPEGKETSIFDPFYSTKEPGHGMGLGLAIVDRYVKDLGGEIIAENNRTGGASFKVNLPLQSSDVEA